VTTTYTLMATGPGGTTTSQATVTVSAALAPTIGNFYFNLPTISAGGSATLFWIVNDASSVSIDQGIGPVASSGFVRVSPHQTTTYHLTATNAAGSSDATATITVTSPVTRHRAARH
jgi:hypothetical protein